MEDTIGERIQIACGIRNVSQTDLAVKLDITRQYLTDLIHGRKNVSKKMLAKISHELHCSREWLETGQGNIDSGTSNVEDIASVTMSILNSPPDSMRRILVTTISSLSDQQLSVIGSIAETIVQQKKKAEGL